MRLIVFRGRGDSRGLRGGQAERVKGTAAKIRGPGEIMDGHRQASKRPLALPLSCANSAVPPLGPQGTGGVYP